VTKGARLPRFSVLVPMRNAAATIEETLASVQGQTVEAWEAVVVDDGSDDGCAELVRRCAVSDDRIHLYSHPRGEHLGTPATRNRTIAEAGGEFLAFLDADDLFLPDALAAYARGLEQHPSASVVYGRAETFGNAEPPREIGRGIPDRPAGLFRQLVSENVLATSATVVRAASVPEAPYPPWMNLSQDWALWVLLARSGSFVYLNRVVSRYRVHAASVTSRMRERKSDVKFELDQARFLRGLLEDLRSTGEDAHEAVTLTPVEQATALRAGLEDRAMRAALRAAGALRQGRVAEAARWMGAALSIAPSMASAVRAMKRAPAERRRMLAGDDPLLDERADIFP